MMFRKKGFITYTAAAIALILVHTSCKTCNCPAYTQHPGSVITLPDPAAKTVLHSERQITTFEVFFIPLYYIV
jgi:hypothetical protein